MAPDVVVWTSLLTLRLFNQKSSVYIASVREYQAWGDRNIWHVFNITYMFQQPTRTVLKQWEKPREGKMQASASQPTVCGLNIAMLRQNWDR